MLCMVIHLSIKSAMVSHFFKQACLYTIVFVIARQVTKCHGASWHAYNQEKKKPSHCATPAGLVDPRTQNVDTSFIKRFKLWPNLYSKQDSQLGETMYGFRVALSEVWQHQHPPDCSKVKFAIAENFEAGFGAETHVLGKLLAVAMNMGRVLVRYQHRMDSALEDKMNSPHSWHVNNSFCRQQNRTSLDCYYEPWSSCTIADALEHTTLGTLALNASTFPTIESLVKGSWSHPARTILLPANSDNNGIIPELFKPLLECSPMHKDKYRFWWRSVAATFMLRPNNATLALIERHRNDDTLQGFDQNSELCVSVHVRRGDKHVEMPILRDLNIFLNASELLWNNLMREEASRQHHKGSSLSLPARKAVMFLGSEDPKVFAEAKEWGAYRGWKVLYTDLFDRNKVSTRLNFSQMEELIKTNAQVHDELEYFSYILNLNYHLKCSAFVCTARSNSCRLTDELRATVGNKVNKQLADVLCNGKLCIDSPEISIDW